MNYYYTIIEVPEHLQTYYRALQSDYVPVIEVVELMDNNEHFVYELSCPQLEKYAQSYFFSL